jgi:hypothetical protein
MAVGFRDRAIVYTENPSTGVYDVIANPNLRCKLKHVSGGTTLPDRAEFAAIRRLTWQPDYYMPEDCEILIGSQRWNPQPNSFGLFRGTNNNPLYRVCDVVEVRAESQ